MISFSFASPKFSFFCVLAACSFLTAPVLAQKAGAVEPAAQKIDKLPSVDLPTSRPPARSIPRPTIVNTAAPPRGTPEYEAYLDKRNKEREIRAELAQKRKIAKEEAFQFTPNPALWKMSDADSTVYLFAAAKRLPYQLKWQSKAFNDALQSADNIYFETPYFDRSDRDIRRENEREGFRKILRHDRDRIEDRFDTGLYEAIRDDVKGDFTQIGDFMPTWLLVSLIADIDRMFQPGRNNVAIDNNISREVSKRDIEIPGLEDPTHLLDELNAVSEKQQRKWLNDFARTEAAADTSKRYKTRNNKNSDPNALLTNREAEGIAWASGKAPTPETEAPAGLRELLQFIREDRMKNWPVKISAMMDMPGTSLVVVNQEYLFGDNNLRSALEEKGYKLVRVK